jgi:hypothetical protein
MFFLLSVLICVNLWLKKFVIHAPKKASNSFIKICENPSNPPHRQASSSLIFFRPPAPPGPPILDPLLCFCPTLPTTAILHPRFSIFFGCGLAALRLCTGG